jgi:hypothetical protein
MTHFGFHHKDTGLLHQRTLMVDDLSPLASATLSAPADHVPIEGVFDYQSQRVDLATGAVVDYQPPQPSPDHEWNASTKRWQPSAAAQARVDGRRAALARIAALEAGQPRTVREAALGHAGALDRLAAVDAVISALRAALHG